MIVQYITLDVLTEIAPVLVYAKVGDTDRTLAISLVSKGQAVEINKDYSAVLTAKRSWGETMVHGCVVDGGLVKYQFNEDTVREIDELKCEIKVFTPEGTLFTSARFGIRVKEPNWTTGDNIVAPSAPTRVLLTPETGAAEGQLLRVKRTVNGIVTELEATDSEYWTATNQRQLQDYLDAGKPTVVATSIGITSPVVISKRKSILKFVGDGCLTPLVKGIAAIVLDAGVGGVLSYTRIENPRIVGNWISGNDSTNGSVGILIKSKGRYNEIIHPKIESCECGIRTGGEYYDGSQTPNVIYEPYFESCRIDTDIQEGWYISSALAVGKSEGGLNAAAAALLIEILRNGVFTSDQSANITALETALSESGGGGDSPVVPDEPSEPVEPPESGVVQSGSVLAITSGVTVTKSGSVLSIA